MSTDGCLPATGSTPRLRAEQGVWPNSNDRGSRGSWLSASRHAQLWWGLVGFVGVDVAFAVPALTGAWWCAYLVLWITPWQEMPRPKNSLASWLNWLSVALVFSWLVYRTLGSLLESVSGWVLSTPIPMLNVLSFPAHTIFASFIAALLVAAPLRRVAGKHAVTIGLVAALPYGLAFGGVDLLSLSRWLDKTLSNSLIFFDCLFPMLMIAEVASLHQRYFDGRDRQSQLRKRGWIPGAALSGQLNASFALFLCGITLAAMFWGQRWLDSFDLTDAGPAVLVVYAGVFPVTALLFLLTGVVAWRCLVRAKRQNERAPRIGITVAQLLVVLAIAAVLLRGFLREAPISGALVSEAIELAVGPLWTVERAGVPGELRCVFRLMPVTDSGACRSPIPADAGHPFWSMPVGV